MCGQTEKNLGEDGNSTEEPRGDLCRIEIPTGNSQLRKETALTMPVVIARPTPIMSNFSISSPSRSSARDISPRLLRKFYRGIPVGARPLSRKNIIAMPSGWVNGFSSWRFWERASLE